MRVGIVNRTFYVLGVNLPSAIRKQSMTPSLRRCIRHLQQKESTQWTTL